MRLSDLVYLNKHKKTAEEIKEEWELWAEKNLSKYIDFISNLDYNSEKGIVMVAFKDGTKVIKRTVGGDAFDLNVGVALAVVERFFGTKTQFHKKVTELKDAVDSKRKRKQEVKALKKILNSEGDKKVNEAIETLDAGECSQCQL